MTISEVEKLRLKIYFSAETYFFKSIKRTVFMVKTYNYALNLIVTLH